MKWKLVNTMLVLSSFAFAQEDSTRFPFNEFEISANRSRVGEIGLKSYTGIGAGIYRSLQFNKKLSLVAGVGFHYNSKRIGPVYLRHFTNIYNARIEIYNLEFPLMLRLSLLKGYLNINGGIFADVIVGSSGYGNGTTLVNSGNTKVYGEKQLETRVSTAQNYGPMVKATVFVPGNKRKFYYCGFYKFGFRKLSVGYNYIFNSYGGIGLGYKLY